MAFEIGRICVKLAGRDAGKTCVIVDVLESGYVLVDGETRRRKCNVLHLEPTSQTVHLKSNASHDEAMKALGIEVNKGAKKSPKAKPSTARKTQSNSTKKAAAPAPAVKKPAAKAPVKK